MLKCLNCELKKLLRHREFFAAMLLGVVFAVLCAAEQMFIFKNTDASLMKPAFRLAMIEDSSSLAHIVLSFLLPILPALAYADSYFTEYAFGADILQLERRTRTQYFVSKAIVVFLAGFTVVVVTYLVNELICLAAFPYYNHNSFTGQGYSGEPFPAEFVQASLFPTLFLQSPYLNNLAHILMAGIWGALLGLMTYSISLFVHKNRIAVLFATTIVITVYSFLAENFAGAYAVSNYISSFPRILDKLNIGIFIGICAVIGIGCAAAITLKCRTYRNELR